MISELTFARSYTSFWNQLLPMGPLTVRNIINRQLTQSFSEPVPEPRRPVRWDVIGEMGVRWLAARMCDGSLSSAELPREEVARLGEEAEAFVRLQRGPEAPQKPPPTPTETENAGVLAQRLIEFLRQFETDEGFIARPPFRGCGIVNSCRGDLLAGATLYEVKANAENFRLADLRQLVIYCALDYAAPRYGIRRIGVVNPRRGTFFRSDLQAILALAGGQAAADLLSEVVDFVSTERASA